MKKTRSVPKSPSKTDPERETVSHHPHITLGEAQSIPSPPTTKNKMDRHTPTIVRHRAFDILPSNGALHRTTVAVLLTAWRTVPQHRTNHLYDGAMPVLRREVQRPVIPLRRRVRSAPRLQQQANRIGVSARRRQVKGRVRLVVNGVHAEPGVEQDPARAPREQGGRGVDIRF